METNSPIYLIVLVFLAIVLLAVLGVAMYSGGQKPATSNANPPAMTSKAELEQNPLVAIELRPAHEGVPVTTDIATEEINNLPEPPPLEVLKRARVVHPQSTTGTGMVEIKGRLY